MAFLQQLHTFTKEQRPAGKIEPISKWPVVFRRIVRRTRTGQPQTDSVAMQRLLCDMDTRFALNHFVRWDERSDQIVGQVTSFSFNENHYDRDTDRAIDWYWETMDNVCDQTRRFVYICPSTIIIRSSSDVQFSFQRIWSYFPEWQTCILSRVPFDIFLKIRTPNERVQQKLFELIDPIDPRHHISMRHWLITVFYKRLPMDAILHMLSFLSYVLA